VIDNWRDELGRWGYFIVSHLGSNHDGGCQETLEDTKNGWHFDLPLLTFVGRLEILICSYSKMQVYASELAEISWSLVVWDEGHNLKTSTTKTYKAAFR
jgi:SNF2 family DNA or RNA helicase